MIRLFTFLLGFSTILHAQVHTTTGAGNFFNPLLWDCFCVPQDGDSLVINHAMTMSAPIYYTSGQITINSGASLLEDGSDRDVWIDGGSFINNGNFNCHRLYISAGSFVNNGTVGTLDSLWNQGTMSSQGVMTIYDFLNDEGGSFNSTSLYLNILNNFNNQGYFFNQGITLVENDFSNCNIQTLDAIFENNGWLCISNDFTNCVDDTLMGSGKYFVGGSSSNFGVFEGDFTFNTSTGSLGINTGTVDAGVTFGNAPCALSVEESETNFVIYPNPANNVLYVSQSNLAYSISDLSGKVIATGTTNTSGIDVSTFSNGIYVIQLQDQNGNISLEKFAKH